MELKEFKDFLARPGINVAGIAQLSGISKFYIYAILEEKRPLTYKTVNKVLPILKEYGFKDKEMEKREQRLIEIERQFNELREKIETINDKAFQDDVIKISLSGSSDATK